MTEPLLEIKNALKSITCRAQKTRAEAAGLAKEADILDRVALDLDDAIRLVEHRAKTVAEEREKHRAAAEANKRPEGAL